MIVSMSASTFLTQKQLMSKNMPASAMDNPFAQQQKILLYVFPVIFAVSGVNFPVGVLLYWLTTNLWTMGQQFYVIRRNPAPGSPAFDALEKRKADKAARRKHEAVAAAAAENLESGTTEAEGGEKGAEATGTEGPQRTPRQRQQPRRQPKRKR